MLYTSIHRRGYIYTHVNFYLLFMYTVIIIGFGEAIYTVDEGSQFVGLNITKSGVSQQMFTVNIILQDRSAEGELPGPVYAC